MRYLRSFILSFVSLGSLVAFADSPASAPADLPALRPNDVSVFEIPPVGTAAPERFYDLFRPFRTEAATLSPDGRRIAYSLREGDNLFVLTFDTDNPARPLAKILAGTTKTSTPYMELYAREDTPARIRWMGWSSPDRLLIETNVNQVTATPLGSMNNTSGGIFGVNADGSKPRTLVTPRDVALFDGFSAAVSGPKSRFSDMIIPTPDIDPETLRNPEPIDAFASLIESDNDLPLDRRSPASPTFFDYDPSDPDWMIVRTSGSRRYGLFHVHTGTGKLRYGPDENVSGDFATLLNRQGLVGSVVANTHRTQFPYTFSVAKTSPISLGRWAPLSTVARDISADFTLSPENFFGQRAFPVGFDENPNVLYYASNVGRDTYAIQGLDVKTGQPAGRTIESTTLDLATPGPDGFPLVNPLVFDRYTRELVGVRYQSVIRSAVWLRDDLRDIQTSMEKILPGRSVDILEWDKSSSRYLALVRGPTDPGAFYLVDRNTRRAQEFVRRSDLPPASEPRFARHFTIDNPAGGQLTGFVVIPNAVRQKPIPTVVLCADDPWKPVAAEFDGEINALAQMGFAVVQINPRGTWGFGTAHRAAVSTDFAETQTADIVTAIDALAKELPLHPARVAIMGRRRGGFLALRAAQLRPDRFRCVVGIEPTVNLNNWIEYTRWTTRDSAPALTSNFFGKELLQQNPLFKDSRLHQRPVFILAYRGNEGGSPTKLYLDARTLARTIENAGTPAQFRDLTYDYSLQMPRARSDALRHIEDFLNINVYNYDVQTGDAKVATTW